MRGTLVLCLVLSVSAAGCADEVSTPDAAVADVGADAKADLPPPDRGPDGPPPLPCSIHHDCPQGSYCYYKGCVTDPGYPVYHCNKKDSSGNDTCPPGHKCVDKVGTISICAESSTYTCKDACDCGPAHCCVDVAGTKRCVKDTADPWLPGGTATGGATCVQGTDATYCHTDPSCHEGRQAHADPEYQGKFRAFDRKTNAATTLCGGRRCFGSAINCKTGESCIDTQQAAPLPGKACLLLSGGTCVSNALAESVFGYKPADLLPKCSSACPKGTACDAGWVSDRKWAYKRIVGTCGSCGNGTCDPGEWSKTCSADCSCGDGNCAPGEVKTCFQDCPICGNYVCDPGEATATLEDTPWFTVCATDCSCGNGSCDPGESVKSGWGGYCPADCTCGDGVCGMAEVCPQDCVCSDSNLYLSRGRVCGDGICDRQACGDLESCLTCPKDCKACTWELVDRSVQSTIPEISNVQGAWGDQTSGFFVAATAKSMNVVLHYNGAAWSAMQLPYSSAIVADIWGTSASNVYLVATLGSGPPLHYDGKTWSAMVAPSSMPPAFFGLGAVWGKGPTEIYAAEADLLRYDGNAKKQWDLVATLPKSHAACGIWGPPGTNSLYTVSPKGISRCDVSAKTCSAMTVPAGSGYASSIWGHKAGSKLDVFAATTDSGKGGIWHHDGNAAGTWTVMSTPSTSSRLDIWGRSANDVFAVETQTYGSNSAVLHFDGKAWTKQAAFAPLTEIWGDGATIYALAGKTGTIYQHDPAAKTWNKVTSWMETGTPTKDTHLKPGGIWGASGTDVFRVAGTTVLRFDGKTWTAMSVPTSAPLYSVWGSSSSDVYAVGGTLVKTGTQPKATLLHYNGKSWTQQSAPMNGPLLDVWATKGSAYAVGKGGTLWGHDGKAWKSLLSTTAEWLAGVHGCSSTKVAAVGRLSGEGLVVLYDTATKGWVPASVSGVTHLYDVWCDAKGNVVAAGTQVGPTGGGPPKIVTCSYAGGGLSCTVAKDLPLIPPPNNPYYPYPTVVRGVWGASASDLYIVGSDGVILHFDGTKWDHAAVDIRTAGPRWGCTDLLGIWGSASSLFITTASGGVIKLEKLP